MTTASESHELSLRCFVPAAPERVFAAWTNAEELLSWWGPPGGRCSDASVDLRVGGAYRIENELSDGTTVTISGEFLAVRPPEHLDYTWTTNPQDPHVEQVTVDFDAQGEGTEVTVTHRRIASVDMMQGHKAGWDSCLQGLVHHLRG